MISTASSQQSVSFLYLYKPINTPHYYISLVENKNLKFHFMRIKFTSNSGITVKLEKEGMTDYENNEFKILSPV